MNASDAVGSGSMGRVIRITGRCVRRYPVSGEPYARGSRQRQNNGKTNFTSEVAHALT